MDLTTIIILVIISAALAVATGLTTVWILWQVKDLEDECDYLDRLLEGGRQAK